MQRKTVTVLFCDVTGSTALGESLDPEALRALLSRTNCRGLNFHVWPGVHNGRYWDAHFAQYLRFYAEACG